MQTPKARSGSSGVPKKVYPRAARQLKITTFESDSAASSNHSLRTPKDRTPKVIDRKSPRSPVSEKKRPSRISELETQVSRLQEELEKTKNQLTSSESLKIQTQHDVEESKKQLLNLTSELEASQNQLSELSSSKEARVAELEKILLDKDQAYQSELETVKSHHSANSPALTSTMNTELNSLKEQLAETLLIVEDMKNQLRNCKESESRAQALVTETLMQLETAKRTIEALRVECVKLNESHNSIASELEQSKIQASLLEGTVNTHESGFSNACIDLFPIHGGDPKTETEFEEKQKPELQAQLISLKSEVENLTSALETAEIKYQEQQIHSTVQIHNAYELVEQTTTRHNQREAELEAVLEKSKTDIEELKANLIDKETELQCIAEENEGLNLKLRKIPSQHKESELEHELTKLRNDVADMKTSLTVKDTEMLNILDENEILRLEAKKREATHNQVAANDNAASEVEAARAAEREAVMKLGFVIEEADKSNRRAARVAEQLEATQAASAEMEAELRRMKVQSDQWRKAAEAAAAMISSGNNGKLCRQYAEDSDDELLKKKNGNVLKKIGVLWKKPQK